MAHTKPAKPFPPLVGSPYLQCFAVTLESGAVILARVMADHRTQGQELARAVALAAFPASSVWDSAAYPCGPADYAAGPGFEVLKRGPRVPGVKGENFSEYEDSTLSLMNCPDGFWLYDSTRGMNLAMKAKTSQAAFIDALQYYQGRVSEVETAERALRAKVESFLVALGIEEGAINAP